MLTKEGDHKIAAASCVSQPLSTLLCVKDAVRHGEWYLTCTRELSIRNKVANIMYSAV
jgi:hypothetical protein